MKLALFVGLFLVSVGAQARNVTVDCGYAPGNYLCRDMANITNAFGYTCTGDACYRVWRGQLQAMDQFRRDYDYFVVYGPWATPEVGELARKAARSLCGSNATGACEWMKALFHAKVAARDRLVELQKAAGISYPSSCSMSYHCP